MSPARCIYCGQSDFVDFSGEEIPCPFQPGTMRCEFVGMCSTSFNEWFFTTEGKRIPLDLKPTYWALKHDIVSELLAETPDPKTAHNNRLMLLVLSFQEAHRHGVVDEESLAELQAHFRHPNVADLCSRWLSLSATLHLGLHWDDISATIRP